MDKPVLSALQELLKLKHTTYSEVASVCGLPKLKVLEVINKNGGMVYRIEKTGKILKVYPINYAHNKLFNNGIIFENDCTYPEYIRKSEYDNHEKNIELKKIIKFNNKGLFDRLSEDVLKNHYMEDKYVSKKVLRTEENITILKDAGLKEWNKEYIDSLKIEDFWEE